MKLRLDRKRVPLEGNHASPTTPIKQAGAPLPPAVLGYILRVSGRHQLRLLLLSVVVFLLSAAPLEIQRRIVNDAIGNGAFTPILWLALAYFSVFGYLAFLQPLVALLCALAFSPQRVFVPLMQRAINRRSAERIETLRSVGGNIVGLDAAASVIAKQDGRLQRVFELNMGIFKIKYSMYFLMNLLQHLGVGTALGVGGCFVVKGQMDVGTVVAFVSGLAKVNDPWGDLVDGFREMTLARTRYRLLRDAMEMLGQRSD